MSDRRIQRDDKGFFKVSQPESEESTAPRGASLVNRERTKKSQESLSNTASPKTSNTSLARSRTESNKSINLPSSKKQDSFEDMLKNLDTMVESGTTRSTASLSRPSRRPKERPAVDALTAQLEAALNISFTPGSPPRGNSPAETRRRPSAMERSISSIPDSPPRRNRLMSHETERQKPVERSRPRAKSSEEINLTNQFEEFTSKPINESIIVPDFVNALIATIRKDETNSPDPQDFLSADGYSNWQQTVKSSFQSALIKILRSKFIDNVIQTKKDSTSVTLFFKIMSATGLLAKEGKTRDAYASIEFGPIESLESSKKDKQVFLTQPVSSNNPTWNQHMNFSVKNLTDKISVTVFDKKKDECLGSVVINTSDLIAASAKEGYVVRHYDLNPREGKKDKYAGGSIEIEAAVEQDKLNALSSDNLGFLQSQMVQCRVNFKSLYRLLLRNCLALDMKVGQFNDSAIELLSQESSALLGFYAKQWAIGEAFQLIAYVELLFEKYKSYQVPTSALMTAMEKVHSTKKRPGWISAYEEPILVSLLQDMYTYYHTQITKYKEFYPKNHPKGALEATIFMLRIIHKNPLYRLAHPELHESFSDEMKGIMAEAMTARYQKLRELSAPLDESDCEAVVEGLIKLGELIFEEIEDDLKYYQKAFQRELDITRMTAQAYLKHFILTLQDHTELFASAEAVSEASKSMFSLYKQLSIMDSKYTKYVPELKRLSLSAGFNIEQWFGPFISNWLDHLSGKTVEWVSNSIKQDDFKSAGGDNLMHSSSINDLFSAVYQELEFILELGDVLQKPEFFQKFAKTVNLAIEQYCDAIAIGEWIEVEQSSWNLLKTAQSAVSKKAPTEIGNESCVKLCNVEYALGKLDDLYKVMNVASFSQHTRRKSSTSKEISGQFTIQLIYAENLKASNKNGLSNPYVLVKIPEKTVADESFQSSSFFKKKTGGPVELTGKDCELVKSRVCYDTLNPSFDESFECILPAVEELHVLVYSKNILAFDQVIGQAVIQLNGARLRKRLEDHQTQDVFVDLDPQGRVLLRLTLEGKGEDVDFWFRKSRERLGRTRDDFVRSLVSRIAPFIKQNISDSIKANEATVAQKGFFSSLTESREYTDQTASGALVNAAISSKEADEFMLPLTDYLNKNLETLCVGLSSRMAAEVIKRIWDECVLLLEMILVPFLFGQIDKEKRVLNFRQLTMVKWIIRILLDFFHADGQGLGLPKKVLKSRRLLNVVGLLEHYSLDLDQLVVIYEKESRSKDCELLLRLIRLKYERQLDLTPLQKEEHLKWFDECLQKRKSQK